MQGKLVVTAKKTSSKANMAKACVALISAGISLCIEIYVENLELKIGLVTLVAPAAILLSGVVEWLSATAGMSLQQRRLKKESTKELMSIRKALTDPLLTEEQKKEMQLVYFEAVKFDTKVNLKQVFAKAT